MAAAPPNSEEDEAPPTLSSLPDALVQHALSFLDSDLAGLGRALCTSVGLSKTGRDDAVWRPFCVGRYGLEDLHDPTNELCDSTVDDVSNPSIFVTYHDAQPYAEYLIKFKEAE